MTSFRIFVFGTRGLASICDVLSLSLFSISLARILDWRFPAVKPGLSALPVVALVITLLWNIVAVATLSRVRMMHHIVGDLFIAAFLAGMAGTGWVHNDRSYFRNGYWRQAEMDDWLMEEIAAGVIAAFAILLQLVLACSSIHGLNIERRHKLNLAASGDAGAEHGHKLELTHVESPPPFTNGDYTHAKKEEEDHSDPDRKSYGSLTESFDTDFKEKL